MTALEQAAVDLLKRIVAEVAGPGNPYSADSFLPPHMVHDAREAIEEFERAEEVPAGLRALGEANEALRFFESLS